MMIAQGINPPLPATPVAGLAFFDPAGLYFAMSF
jgi:hypothetical protein